MSARTTLRVNCRGLFDRFSFPEPSAVAAVAAAAGDCDGTLMGLEEKITRTDETSRVSVINKASLPPSTSRPRLREIRCAPRNRPVTTCLTYHPAMLPYRSAASGKSFLPTLRIVFTPRRRRRRRWRRTRKARQRISALGTMPVCSSFSFIGVYPSRRKLTANW